MSLFYFSFADPTKPKGTQWLGGLYVEGDNFIHAVQEAHRTGQNPGGEIMSINLDDAARERIKPEYWGRLLNIEEMENCGVDGPETLCDMNGNEL